MRVLSQRQCLNLHGQRMSGGRGQIGRMKQRVGGRKSFCFNPAKFHRQNNYSIDMGHTRLGTLAATRSWKAVIGLIAEGASVEKIAEATTNAWRLPKCKAMSDLREAALH